MGAEDWDEGEEGTVILKVDAKPEPPWEVSVAAESCWGEGEREGWVERRRVRAGSSFIFFVGDYFLDGR